MEQIFHGQFSLYDRLQIYKACHKLFKWVKQHLMITNSISTSYSINIF